MTDPELETLAQLLSGLGVALNVTDAEGHLLISGPAARHDAGAELPRTVSMNLADGRRLVLVPDAEAERRNAEARQRFLPPLYEHLEHAGLGHVSEIADAEPPHTPRGCPFQAWSLGEILRLDRVILAVPNTKPRTKRKNQLVPA